MAIGAAAAASRRLSLASFASRRRLSSAALLYGSWCRLSSPSPAAIRPARAMSELTGGEDLTPLTPDKIGGGDYAQKAVVIDNSASALGNDESALSSLGSFRSMVPDQSFDADDKLHTNGGAAELSDVQPVEPDHGSYDNGPTSDQLRMSLRNSHSSLNNLAMKYLFNSKNNVPFYPMEFVNNLVTPGTNQPDEKRKEENLDMRIRFCIGFFVDTVASKKSLTPAEKKLLQLINQGNQVHGAGNNSSNLAISGPNFVFPRDGVGILNSLSSKDAREELLGQLRTKCLNRKDKTSDLIEKIIDRKGDLTEAMEMIIQIILRKRVIPYGYNSFSNEVQKMRHVVANMTSSDVSIDTVKIKSIFQSASMIAQDIAFQLRSGHTPFRTIYSNIVKDIPQKMPRGVEGIRIVCKGRLGGAEKKKIECGKYGKTSRNVLNEHLDYARSEAYTRYGTSGVKVWVNYTRNKKERKKLGYQSGA